MALDLLEQILPHVKDSIYPSRTTLFDWKMKEGDHPEAASPTLNDKSWGSIRIPFQWGKYDKIYWFRYTLKVTQEFAGKPLALLLDFPEALLFLNGKPYHGVDRQHQEIWITEKAKLDEQFVIAIQAYSGRRHEHNTFARAELAVLDATARRLASGLLVLQEIDKLVDHGSQESKDIRELIRHTLVYLKYFRPGSEEYPNAIRRAYNFLLNTLETEYKTALPGIVHLIGHSQIDYAWLWNASEAARKTARTFASVLQLMKEFPEFKFSQGQAILYDLIKAEYPELFKQIKQRIAEGHWEAMGSVWVEPDCNIPSGESLVRQILFGKRYFRQELGIESDVLWLPHSFGFTWALPQILQKSGVKYFATSALTSNDTTQFPFTSFHWQGIDGSKVLTHLPGVGLEGQITPKSILQSGKPALEQPPVSPVLQTYGFGDGGGGPTKENIELAVILKSITGLTSSKLSSVQEFFKQMEEQAENLPTWSGEIYLEGSRGTYTSQALIKKQNRQCERHLYNAELLSTIATVFGKKASARRYPQNEIEQAWKKLLRNQGNTVISGISIADVYKDSERDYQSIGKTCSEIVGHCIQTLSRPGKKGRSEFHYAVFNTLGWQRNDYVEISIKSKEKNFDATDGQGNPVAFQILDRTGKESRLLCYVENIPAFGFKNIIVTPRPTAGEKSEEWKMSAHGIESPFFKARFDNNGLFTSIYAKHVRRELLQKGKRGNMFQTFKETPKPWEIKNIDADFEKHRIELWKLKQIKYVERGPLRATVRLELRSESGSILTQNIHFYHKLPRIDFVTALRWRERQTLMKVAFPLNLKSSKATYEIQFGAVARPTKPTTDAEKAKFEVPAQQWADISDAKYGVSVLNDCKYGYDAKESTLRLTLIRSPHYPHPVESGTNDTELADQGEHKFCYSLYPHSGDWIAGKTVARAHELNNPVLVFPNIAASSIPVLIQSSKPNIVIDAIKKAELSSDIIVRMHEAHGTAAEISLRLGIDVKEAAECDLEENDQRTFKVQKGAFSIKFKAFEIKTIRLTPKPSKGRRI
jgi:alpha-mannosidase